MSVTPLNLGRTLNDVLAPPSQRVESPPLGQQDFLKIMIEQLKTQNPLDGGSDTNDFFAQLVQFQSLEAMQGMTKAIQQLADVSTLSNAASLIGRTVTAEIPPRAVAPGEIPGPAEEVTGVVAAVVFESSGPVVYLENGQALPASRIVAVA